jgi:peptide chain release factor 1
VLRIVGSEAYRRFRGEAGGHRWQRVPPTERRGRMQSSTVTVAVFPERSQREFQLDERDLELTTCRGSGPGGQHRNKTESAVQVKHKPTGLIVRCESERSQAQNKESALRLLASRLAEAAVSKRTEREADSRRQQIGSGERSDKVRTIQTQNNVVVNHLTGKKAALDRYLKGDIWIIA